MNWLERARREIRESRQTPTANTAERNLTAVMAVSDPVICADYQACAHKLEDQTSQQAHREIQKSMQTSTANTAERNLTAVMAVSDPVICAESRACVGSGGAVEIQEFPQAVPGEFAAVELRFDSDDLSLETSTPPADAVLDLLLRHKIPIAAGDQSGWLDRRGLAGFLRRARRHCRT